jgi:hypothetical protein
MRRLVQVYFNKVEEEFTGNGMLNPFTCWTDGSFTINHPNQIMKGIIHDP